MRTAHIPWAVYWNRYAYCVWQFSRIYHYWFTNMIDKPWSFICYSIVHSDKAYEGQTETKTFKNFEWFCRMWIFQQQNGHKSFDLRELMGWIWIVCNNLWLALDIFDSLIRAKCSNWIIERRKKKFSTNFGVSGGTDSQRRPWIFVDTCLLFALCSLFTEQKCEHSRQYDAIFFQEFYMLDAIVISQKWWKLNNITNAK